MGILSALPLPKFILGEYRIYPTDKTEMDILFSKSQSQIATMNVVVI